MATKRISAKRNPKTGSYTVRIPKSTSSGKFVSNARKPARIIISGRKKTSS